MYFSIFEKPLFLQTLEEKIQINKCWLESKRFLNPLVPGKFFFEFFAQIHSTGVIYDQTDRAKVILR
jgi:hypothetical protein